MKELTDSKAYLLYLIICSFKDDFFIKIGRSRNLYSRIKNIQSGCPHQIDNIFIIASEFEEEILGLEGVLHKLIDNYKLKGEWYLGVEDFFEIFNILMQRINEGKLGDYVFENEDLFSIDEVEILFHCHEYSFYELLMPIKREDIIKCKQLSNPKEIYTIIKNTSIIGNSKYNLRT